METQRRKVATVVRVRPLLREEVAEDPRAKYIAVKLHPGNRRLTLTREAAVDRDFDFDGIAYYKTTTQESFYQQYCLPAVNELLDGFNTSFIVYGTVILCTHICRQEPARRTQCLAASQRLTQWRARAAQSVWTQESLVGASPRCSTASRRFADGLLISSVV